MTTKAYTISATYTPSAADAAKLNDADMLAYARTALEHIFEADRLTDLAVRRTGIGRGTLDVEVPIDNDTDLAHVKTLMGLIDEASYPIPGWLWDGSGLPTLYELLDQAVSDYERQQREKGAALHDPRRPPVHETGPDIQLPNDCPHDHVARDDDGLSRYFHRCLDCDQELVLSEPDEDGQSTWEAIE